MSPVSYHLGQFPPPELDWPCLIPLIGPANAAIARYEGVLHGIPSPFLAPICHPLGKKGQRGAMAQLLPSWVDEMSITSARWVKTSSPIWSMEG